MLGRRTGETGTVTHAEAIDTTVPLRPAVEHDRAVGPAVEHDRATRAFSTSVLVSGIRCTLAYVVFPWLAPALGVAGGVGPALGLVISPIAVGFNVASIRRFQVSGHRWRWHITALNGAVIALLLALLVMDARELL